MRINHNIPALNSYRNLGMANTTNSKSMEKLSSGLRINRAADDAAGLAISETMRGQIKGLNQASRNSQDAISLLQTAEGGLTETNSILLRMRELSVQASNDTYTSNDRQEMQKEVDQLKEEIDRIANTTSFNNKNLLDGSASAITSSDKMTTKVIMRAGLRTVDSFGQKSSGGGSYKLDISATAGNAQIQKSNIFKINTGGNSVQSLNIDPNSGIDHVSATDLQFGNYTIKTDTNSATTATATINQNQYYAKAGAAAPGDILGGAGYSVPVDTGVNLSAEFEVTAKSGDSVDYSFKWTQYAKDGTKTTGTGTATGVNLATGGTLALNNASGTTITIAAGAAGQADGYGR